MRILISWPTVAYLVCIVHAGNICACAIKRHRPHCTPPLESDNLLTRQCNPIMDDSVSIVFFLFFSTVFYQGLCERFYIVASPGSPCPGELTGEPCITLQQYVSTPSHSANVTLILQPGDHDLNSDLIAESS